MAHFESGLIAKHKVTYQTLVGLNGKSAEMFPECACVSSGSSGSSVSSVSSSSDEDDIRGSTGICIRVPSVSNQSFSSHLDP